MNGCQCSYNFQFPEYHWPHCPYNPARISGVKDRLSDQARALTTVSQLPNQKRHVKI